MYKLNLHILHLHVVEIDRLRIVQMTRVRCQLWDAAVWFSPQNDQYCRLLTTVDAHRWQTVWEAGRRRLHRTWEHCIMYTSEPLLIQRTTTCTSAPTKTRRTVANMSAVLFTYLFLLLKTDTTNYCVCASLLHKNIQKSRLSDFRVQFPQICTG